MIDKCPKCNSILIKKVKWTWWGGALGPAILNSTKCESYGHTFNGNTGKSNTGAIVIYSIIVLVLGIVISVMMNS